MYKGSGKEYRREGGKFIVHFKGRMMPAPAAPALAAARLPGTLVLPLRPSAQSTT